LIISIIAIIAFQFLFRKKRSPDANNATIVQGLLSEIRMNSGLVDLFTYDKPGKKFMTTSWQLYQGKLDFLSQELRRTISDTFMLAEEYNQQISSAKKTKSTSYLAGLDMGKLKTLLTKSQQGLESWFSAHSSMEEATPKTPGIFGDFTGR
jgi:hypothetical protein